MLFYVQKVIIIFVVELYVNFNNKGHFEKVIT